MAARAPKRRRRTLVIGVPWTTEKRRQRGEHEIHGGHDPQSAPVRPHIRKVRPHLVEADGKICLTASTGSGIASRGQANPTRKSCGMLVARKRSTAVSRCLNQAPAACAIKLVARMN